MFIKDSVKFGDKVTEYLIDFPKNFDKNKKYPVLLYLHGHGAVNHPIERLKDVCPVRRERVPKDCEFILVVPHCPETFWLFRFETLTAFIGDMIDKPYVDRDRVYVAGSSMGGYATWQVLLYEPQVFAAAIVCCGGGQYWALKCANGAFKHFPVKIIHGEKDGDILPRESVIMAESLNKVDGRAELTLYPELAHDVWTVTFTSPDTYKWLLSHKKSDR